ncbi:MAG: hypothetical protein FJZ00_08870 [Candidatus Sericytochromatia bacterium]|uniref:Uncharacterized protein n=1 Tax=Candidatus Tanganyikabacteria bacterium TaxID=2961651 RepID=A0A938BNC9_9BACT|nr:hypothetical protein [Candidatus Tanganyikabacteria bacterium]
MSDAGGAVLDGYSAYKSAKEGDAGRTMGYGMQAAGGVASAAAGVAILAGASGPAAPIVLIGGTLLIGGGMLVNYFFGDTDEEKFLKTMGRDFGYGNDHFYHDKYNRRSRTLVNGAPPPLRLD